MTTAMGATLRRIQYGSALAAFGSGFTVPYLFLYVARVRQLGAGTAGATLAVFAAAAFLVLPFVGRAIDRHGPLPVALGGTLAASAGALGFGMSSSALWVLVSSAVMGAGIAVLQPALATMIVWSSSTATRSRAFATQFFLLNLGMGFGGLLGGQIVDEHRPWTFTLLFGIEALMFLVLAAVLVAVRLPRSSAIDPAYVPAAHQEKGADGWRRLLTDRAMVLLCVLGFVLFFTCYGQFESGLAVYGTQVAGISTKTLGTALFANTAAIVLAQFLVLRLVDGRRRSRAIALAGAVWTVAWLAAGISGLVAHAQVVATALFVMTYALFGLGESLLAPTLAPLVADLAPQRMVGRYNAAFALVKQLGVAVGPAVGGLMAAQHAWTAYIVLLLGCSLAVIALALVLGRRLAPEHDRPRRTAGPYLAGRTAPGSRTGATRNAEESRTSVPV